MLCIAKRLPALAEGLGPGLPRLGGAVLSLVPRTHPCSWLEPAHQGLGLLEIGHLYGGGREQVCLLLFSFFFFF